MSSLIRTGITFVCLAFLVGIVMVVVCKFMPAQEKKVEGFLEKIVLQETGIDITPALEQLEEIIAPESPKGASAAIQPS